MSFLKTGLILLSLLSCLKNSELSCFPQSIYNRLVNNNNKCLHNKFSKTLLRYRFKKRRRKKMLMHYSQPLKLSPKLLNNNSNQQKAFLNM